MAGSISIIPWDTATNVITCALHRATIRRGRFGTWASPSPTCKPARLPSIPTRSRRRRQLVLIYARDFLDTTGCSRSPTARRPRVGTALVVHRLVTMTELGPELTVVMRAHHDWQLFEASRAIYDRVLDWHTLEGPSVVKHEGTYFCFYSGGCWKSDGYGVDYAKADTIGGPYSDDGAEQGPRVLRSSPGEGVRGPGHNSTVLGPDGCRYVAYHAWNREMTLRQCPSPSQWTTQGPRISPMTSGPLIR